MCAQAAKSKKGRDRQPRLLIDCTVLQYCCPTTYYCDSHKNKNKRIAHVRHPSRQIRRLYACRRASTTTCVLHNKARPDQPGVPEKQALSSSDSAISLGLSVTTHRHIDLVEEPAPPKAQTTEQAPHLTSSRAPSLLFSLLRKSIKCTQT